MPYKDGFMVSLPKYFRDRVVKIAELSKKNISTWREFMEYACTIAEAELKIKPFKEAKPVKIKKSEKLDEVKNDLSWIGENIF